MENLSRDSGLFSVQIYKYRVGRGTKIWGLCRTASDWEQFGVLRASSGYEPVQHTALGANDGSALQPRDKQFSATAVCSVHTVLPGMNAMVISDQLSKQDSVFLCYSKKKSVSV